MSSCQDSVTFDLNLTMGSSHGQLSAAVLMFISTDHQQKQGATVDERGQKGWWWLVCSGGEGGTQTGTRAYLCRGPSVLRWLHARLSKPTLEDFMVL